MNHLTEVRLQKTAPKIDKTSDEVEMAGPALEVDDGRDADAGRDDPSHRHQRCGLPMRTEGSSLASVSGFYGTAVAPPGSALIAWQGAGDGGAATADPIEDEERSLRRISRRRTRTRRSPTSQPDSDPSDPTQQQ